MRQTHPKETITCCALTKIMLNTLEIHKENLLFRLLHNKLKVRKENTQGLVLSITSIRERLPTLHLPIFRMIRYGLLPDHVEIWLSESIKPYVTNELRSLQNNGCSINFIKDIGPATKLYYSLIKHPRSAIVSIDDDLLLPPGSLGKLVNHAKKNPGAVICNMARHMMFDNLGQPLPYDEWGIVNEESKAPRFDILPLGHGGVYYPAGVLNDLVLNIEMMKQLCPWGDDLWFTAMRLLNGNPAFHCGPISKNRTRFPETKNSSIKARTNSRGNDDQSIERLFAKFHLSTKIRSASRLEA